MNKRKIVLFSPSLNAVSGVSTHVRILFASDLAREYDLLHFQVGGEGRRENALQKLMRFTLSPLHLALFLLRTGAQVVHMNASLDPKSYWRDLVYSIVARLLGRRVVNQIHGGAMPQDFFRGNACLTWILRRFLVSSDVVTVLSSGELTAYRAFDSRIKVHLVPNAIDPAGLADQMRQLREEMACRGFFFIAREDQVQRSELLLIGTHHMREDHVSFARLRRRQRDLVLGDLALERRHGVRGWGGLRHLQSGVTPDGEGPRRPLVRPAQFGRDHQLADQFGDHLPLLLRVGFAPRLFPLCAHRPPVWKTCRPASMQITAN